MKLPNLSPARGQRRGNALRGGAYSLAVTAVVLAILIAVNVFASALPASLTSLGDGVFQDCTGLTSLSVDSGNTAYSAENGVLYDGSKTTLMLYPAKKADTVSRKGASGAGSAFDEKRFLTNGR